MKASAYLLTLVCLFPGMLVAAELDYRLQARRIAADTYVFEGRTEHFSFNNGGNIVNTAFIATQEGVIVIDTGPSKRYGEQMRKAIRQVSDQPIVQVFITHLHPDHFLGNQAFMDVPIAALAGTIQGIALQGEDFATNMYRLVGNWMLDTGVVPPKENILPGSIEIGGHQLELLALRGHSGADLAVLDHTTGVLFAADLVFNQRTPTTPHADIQHWLDSLQILQTLEFDILVPGHGPVMENRQAITMTADYLNWLRDSLQQAAELGLSMAEVLQLPIPQQFAELDVLREEYLRSVSHLYPALERAALGLAQKATQ